MAVHLEALNKEQRKLAQKIVLTDGFTRAQVIGGVTQAFVGNTILSCVVVCDRSLKVMEKAVVSQEAAFPSIPGFRAYREMPAMVAAYEKIKQKPDVILVDGNGILHPRRLGLASHFGLAIDTPTIGVTTSLLLGKVEKGKVYVGTEVRGVEMTTREHANPLYVSPGYKVSIGTALRVVQESMRYPHKLPEPLHYAHKYVTQERKRKVGKKIE